MNDPIKLAKIKESNARYFGMSQAAIVENAGAAIAKEVSNLINTKFSKPEQKRITVNIICGSGNNGADGMATAKHLLQIALKNKLETPVALKVFLIGRAQELTTEAGQTAFYELKQLEKKLHSNKKAIIRAELNLIQDAYAKDFDSCEIVIEALLGTGINGILRKRFKDVVNKIARLHAYKIAVDIPVPGYKADLILSLITPKRKTAKTLDIDLPREVDEYVGPGHLKFLYTPPKNSYKGINGELLIFGGSELFHGAPIMAIKAASKFIGGVFFYTNPVNRDLISKQKTELQEFITLREQDLEKFANYSNVILIGPGLEENLSNKALITYLLNAFPEKLFVLDAYAIAMANPERNKQNKRGFKNCILTPHRGELRHIFDETKLAGLEGKLRNFCIKNKCITILKGSIDMLFNSDGQMLMDKTGNAGMAKGGTGDILSGIIAALACKNDPWDAAIAGTFLNGAAGDLAYKKYGYNYSATDLIPYLQEAYKWGVEF